MMIYLLGFMLLYAVIFLIDRVDKRRFRRAMQWMVASMRCGHFEECDRMLRQYPEAVAVIQQQIDLVKSDLKR